MIKIITAFGEEKELTVESAVRWLAQEGFGRPYALTMAQRNALPRFLASRDSIYGFLQRESFMAALQRFASANGVHDRDDPRRPKRILFVGGIDGKAELSFLRSIDWGGTAVITSYGPMSDALATLPDRLPHAMRARLQTRGQVDATNLRLAFPASNFDFVAWIGPTNDLERMKTANLVDLFVTSAGTVLNRDGAVIVIQDLKSPLFRDILNLPGANLYSDIQLMGRTQTESGDDDLVRLDGRVDHVVFFYFGEDGKRIVDPDAEFQKTEGAKVVDSILKAKEIPVAQKKGMENANQTSREVREARKQRKYDLMDRIFSYAKRPG
jgi:hypothetical protein